MPVSRAISFIRSLIVFVAVMFLIGFIVYVAQTQTGFLDPFLAQAKVWLDQANGFLDTNMMAGISASMIVLALLVLMLPMIMKGIQRKQYATAVRRGTIASVVFFVSQLLYSWAEAQGRSMLIVAMVLVLVVSFVIIEILARLLRKEDESSFRTDMLASMSSGLLSGIVLKLIEVIIKGGLSFPGA